MLKHFQKATVGAAVEALTKRDGAQRFLIADEVGLGKTVVAAAITQCLAGRALDSGNPFCVVYFGSNLQLLSQNGGRLFPGKEEPHFEEATRLEADRVSLAWQWKPDKRFRLAMFTPSTSLPDLDASSFSTGTREERVVAAAWANFALGKRLDRRISSYLATGTAQPLTKQSQARLEEFDRRVRSIAGKIRSELRASRSTTKRMSRAFSASLAASLKIQGRARGRTIQRVMCEKLNTSEDVPSRLRVNLGEIRRQLRIALCSAALARGVLKPDLIILDEFQNYSRLLKQVDKNHLASSIFSSAAVLLLSATPFAWKRGGDATEPLDEIVGFLVKNASKTRDIREKAAKFRETLLREHIGDERAAWTSVVETSRDALEEALRPVMERTERWDDELMATPTPTTPGPIPAARDLKIFDDLANRVRSIKNRQLISKAVSHVPLIWMSLPYPAQTLPKGYVVSSALAQSQLKPRVGVSLKGPTDRHSPRSQAPSLDHPKLRSFLNEVSTERSLALPWLPPSLPWWPLDGAWLDSAKTAPKSLVFSRFRATPPAISGLVSFAVERATGSASFKWKDIPRYSRLGSKRGEKSRELRFLFHPWTVLATFDPLNNSGGGTEAILHLFKKKAKETFKSRRSAKQDPFGRLTEVQIEAIAQIQPASQDETLNLAVPRRSGVVGVVATESIAKLALGGPGVILLRSLQRHFGSETNQHLAAIADLSWNFLRPYLGRRYFDHALARRSRRGLGSRSAAEREGLVDAIIDGNLEAVLDEHIAAYRLLNSKRSHLEAVLANFKEILSLSDGALALHEDRPKRRIFARLRAHAALAYSGQETAKKGPLRPKQLQAAFNSPFWPHVLSTTSVGQEGLDFHVWCSRVVHWDPPADPISLEQREGRVARFASLAVRRALACSYGQIALSKSDENLNKSPWARIFETAESDSERSHDKLGLQPWWVLKGGQYNRVVLAPSHSVEMARFDDLIEELALYRLAFGQPDPQLFASRLRGRLKLSEIRKLAVDISSLRLRRT